VGSSTLKYGSSDAGHSFIDESPKAKKLAKKVAKALNLKKHYSRGNELYGPW
jgi:hypothetical protein